MYVKGRGGLLARTLNLCLKGYQENSEKPCDSWKFGMALSLRLLGGLEDFHYDMCDTVLFEDIEKPY